MIPFSSQTVQFRADKGDEYTGKAFDAHCLETDIKQAFTATNTPQQQIHVSERVGRVLCVTFCCLLVDCGLPPNLWVNVCSHQHIYAIEFPIRHSRWKHHTKLSTARALTHLTSRSLESGPSFTSSNQLNLGKRSGKGWCAVPENNTETPIACGTPGSELSLNRSGEKLLDEDKKLYQSTTSAVKFPATTSFLP